MQGAKNAYVPAQFKAMFDLWHTSKVSGKNFSLLSLEDTACEAFEEEMETMAHVLCCPTLC